MPKSVKIRMFIKLDVVHMASSGT